MLSVRGRRGKGWLIIREKISKTLTMNGATLLEDMLYQFLKNHLSDVEIRDLSSRADILSHVDEETEEEIKTELYNTFVRLFNAQRLITELRNELVESEPESDSSSDEEEED